MQWFNNLKIRTKLITGFAIVSVITAILGLIAISNIHELNRNDTRLYEVNTVNLEAYGNISTSFQRMRLYVQKIITAIDNEEINKYKKQIEDDKGAIQKEKEIYERNIADKQDEGNFKNFDENFKIYTGFIEKVIDATYAKNYTEQRTLINGMVQKAIQVNSILKEMRDYNNIHAKETSQRNSNIAGSAIATMIILLIGAVIISLSLGLFIAQIISRPITRLENASVSFSKGDLKSEIVIKSKDELGHLANSFNIMVTKFRSLIQKVLDQTDSITKESDELYAISDIAASASAELQAQSSSASSSSEQISSNVSTVATSTEEMTSSIKEISKNTSTASHLTRESEKRANEASEVMNRLGQSSHEIGNIIKAINSIAEQTNLLALNATIEAARAGESGKGFAVVANEVKDLAKESAKATEDIASKIKAIREDSENAIVVIKSIIENSTHVNEVTNSIASAIEEQSVTTNEVNRNLSEATIGVNSFVEIISGISSAANDYANQASSIKSTSGKLKNMANTLESEITNNFKF
jgi:methyl-accepting chemotaxis protein